MPELPEVETIVRQLNERILNKTISDVELFDNTIISPKVGKLRAVKINKIWRRSKSILMELENGSYLLTHLGMTGHFHYVRPDDCQKSRYRNFMLAKFNFNDNSFLTYNDIRKFGKIKLLSPKELDQELKKYGPEPLAEEFTAEKFRQRLLEKKNANLKAALMDYRVIAGIGNIYAQEALYRAGISPLRKAGTLSASESDKLYQQVRSMLAEAIELKGSTVDNYSNLDGLGKFQNFLVVYNRNKCPKGHDLRKVLIGGRGSAYCPKCQK